MKNYSSVPGHKDAIDTYLRLEATWDFFKICTIVECEDCWIVDGRIIEKEVT